MNGSVLVLLRHGQSVWNLKNVFTGWVDVPLSNQGIREAIEAGRAFDSIPFDVCFTSTLVRAQMTLMLAMSQHRDGKTPVVVHPEEKRSKVYSDKVNILPVHYSSDLNERMYGELQGKNKDEMREQFGPEQVKIWRRSFDVAPPEGESLKMTSERTLPYFDQTIVPCLKRGQNVIVSAHGNSLRSIVMELDGLSPEEVVNLEIPTGVPICYLFQGGKWIKSSVEELQARYRETA
ncbi:MAG: 2,3-bisphosphoglycerate-dependent phosphoglycerate mutase [Simkaniaceae bacterium]|nr:2,3-bisphosphoglycerate-dependent phosphoglycerate mutase [Simkaniaceae bacterium]